MLKRGWQKEDLVVGAAFQEQGVFGLSPLLPDGCAVSERARQMTKGRGNKLVTEDWKPVGSGRFRDQTRDAEAVPGLFLALLIQDLPPDVSLLCREVNSRHPCFRSGNVIFPIRYDLMNSSFCSQTPKKRERITSPMGQRDIL